MNTLDFPKHMTPIGMFTYLRTYSRYKEKEGRREVWRETVERAANYNISLAIKHLKKHNIPYDETFYVKELEILKNNMFNLKQFLSGRTLWVGGADNGVADKYPLANFNCSFTNIEKWEDLCEMFYLLLVGTGVGFKCTKEMAKNIEPIRKDVVVTHLPYEPVPKHERKDGTELSFYEGMRKAKITVGDSKEGWVDSLRLFFALLSKPIYESIREIEIDYNNVRPAGEPLKTFGGTASGHEPLRDMFTNIMKVFNNEIDPTLDPLEHVGNGYYQVRPIHILDIGNFIGYNVVVGGVRRTAEIFLCDADDWESIFAKFGLNGYWKEEDFQQLERIIGLLKKEGIPYPKRIETYLERNVYGVNEGSGLHHRRMSNNSIAFVDKPSKAYLDIIFEIMKLEGEPGFINLYEAARRRLSSLGVTPTDKLIKETVKDLGINPCAEILLNSKGVCNLTTVNVMGFVKNGKLDLWGLVEAQKLSARCGLRMTLVDLELEEWDKVQKRDRLLGCSLTGWRDAMDALGYTEEQEETLKEILSNVAREEADRYAKELRVNSPLLVTTVKPEGTLSVVAGAVSSGLHYAYAPYYIRRVRINAHDPLAKAVLEHEGWNVYAEVGTCGHMEEEMLKKPEVIAQANTLVIEFPVKTPSKVTGDDIPARKQLENYFSFQEYYTEHNSSNTIRVKSHEWQEVSDIIFENWNDFVGVSFLAHDGGTYKLTPYEATTKEVYENMSKAMQPFDFEILKKYENYGEQDLDMSGCDSGICPVR